MNELVQVAIVTGLVTTVCTLVPIMLKMRSDRIEATRQREETNKKVVELKDAQVTTKVEMNSRLTEMMEIAKALAHSLGVKEGMEKEQANQALRDSAAAAAVPPPVAASQNLPVDVSIKVAPTKKK